MQEGPAGLELAAEQEELELELELGQQPQGGLAADCGSPIGARGPEAADTAGAPEAVAAKAVDDLPTPAAPADASLSLEEEDDDMALPTMADFGISSATMDALRKYEEDGFTPRG